MKQGQRGLQSSMECNSVETVYSLIPRLNQEIIQRLHIVHDADGGVGQLVWTPIVDSAGSGFPQQSCTVVREEELRTQSKGNEDYSSFSLLLIYYYLLLRSSLFIFTRFFYSSIYHPFSYYESVQCTSSSCFLFFIIIDHRVVLLLPSMMIRISLDTVYINELHATIVVTTYYIIINLFLATTTTLYNYHHHPHQ